MRCAVYTRKSTEDGLDQEFNSLDAQREACAAYITSQRHEGWTPLPEHYDDGGFSGGSMERPAFKRLLAEVAAGRVDVIVIYKVDRLTRSLADFSRIVDVPDRAKASFVSITHAFNTTTSMGRLTLNMLLSFAQFEREVTGKRIRDKIAASKRKELWMGGPVPLGYAVQDRRLVVVDAEAELVRHIMRRYLALGSVRELVAELAAQGHRTKLQPNAGGPHRGGIRLGGTARDARVRGTTPVVGRGPARDAAARDRPGRLIRSGLRPHLYYQLRHTLPAPPKRRGSSPFSGGTLQRYSEPQSSSDCVVRSRRLELPRPFGHSHLKAARLPIPPRPHVNRRRAGGVGRTARIANAAAARNGFGGGQRASSPTKLNFSCLEVAGTSSLALANGRLALPSSVRCWGVIVQL